MNMDKDNSYEIPFGAKDSELKGWEYKIPEGMEAEIKDGKIIVREKESEDEMIRKALIQHIKYNVSVILGWRKEELIALLEKQGSQNLVDKVELKFKAGDKVISTISNIPYYITEVCNGYYLTDVGCIIMFNAQDNFELVGHNSAWSEEDETGLNDAMWAIEQARTIAKNENDMGNLWYAERWLKSLKSRVQPQPKSEWSEEDKKLINDTCNLINTLASGYGEKVTEPITFSGTQMIASIKDRLRALVDNRPQNTWKPSDEQMEAVRIAAEIGTANNSWAMDVLKSMHQDLKKLKR